MTTPTKGKKASSDNSAAVSCEANTSKPYANSRPSYAKGQVDEVYENARQADGKVYDPNTGVELPWDRSKPRSGQWDMGHIPDKPYRALKLDFLSGKISLKDFLSEYRNPQNYRPELPSNNRSRKYELKTQTTTQQATTTQQ